MWTSIESDIVVVYVSGHPHVFESGMGKASSAGCDSVERRGVQIYGGVWKGYAQDKVVELEVPLGAGGMCQPVMRHLPN